jgi:hypothetical protein
MTQPPDLSKLHDFYQPPPPSWMPQTAGWYALLALFCIFAMWLLARVVTRWLSNRYRREALQQLQSAHATQFSALLKRTAMAVWPREDVASLSGEEWLKFLSASSGLDEFNSNPGNLIEHIAIAEQPLTAADEQRLRQLASEWVRTHHHA